LTVSKTAQQLRRFHKFLAPIMVLPLLLTALTGVLFQTFDSMGQERSVRWLLALHKGHFGIVNLSGIYPFLNALGLVVLAVTGFFLWLQPRRSAIR
jgi:uncharacterized iron-regulated membrane protein